MMGVFCGLKWFWGGSKEEQIFGAPKRSFLCSQEVWGTPKRFLGSDEFGGGLPGKFFGFPRGSLGSEELWISPMRFF